MRHPNQEVAALRESLPGDVAAVHAHDCSLASLRDPTEEQVTECSCTPLVLVVGAEA